jgi:hypothetical protein
VGKWSASTGGAATGRTHNSRNAVTQGGTHTLAFDGDTTTGGNDERVQDHAWGRGTRLRPRGTGGRAARRRRPKITAEASRPAVLPSSPRRAAAAPPHEVIAAAR